MFYIQHNLLSFSIVLVTFIVNCFTLNVGRISDMCVGLEDVGQAADPVTVRPIRPQDQGGALA
jgi:hypothetical protein